MVMMNMMSSTSMTSINGVVLMSIIGSAVRRLRDCMHSCLILLTRPIRAAVPPCGGRLGNEADARKPARCMVKIAPPMQRYGVLMSPRICASGSFVLGDVRAAADARSRRCKLVDARVEQFLRR